MTLSVRFSLVGLGALALLSGVHWLRAHPGTFAIVPDYLVGVLPNFAAALAITFVVLGIWAGQNEQASNPAVRQAFFLATAFSGVGLVGWEVFQLTSAQMVFDFHDIVATGAGLLVGIVVFHTLLPARNVNG